MNSERTEAPDSGRPEAIAIWVRFWSRLRCPHDPRKVEHLGPDKNICHVCWALLHDDGSFWSEFMPDKGSNA